MDKTQKYNRKDIEKKWKQKWTETGVYKFKYDKNKKNYIVDTPPPYVNADHLHAGHIMSYSQAEFVVRYKRMAGFNVFYPMGFDDNGYPTERFIEKKYKVDKNKITKKEFIKLCLEETEKGAQTYKDLWTNLGISIDWDLTYSTISPIAVKVSQKSLLDLYKKGYLYRKESPILWSVDSQTALAQTDLEDKLMKAKLNYINFKTQSGKTLTIATSRPEMLAACVALYCNPNDKRFKHLVEQKAIVPIFNHEVNIKTSEDVDPEFGTGLMMVCTWGDQEDVKKWARDNLDTREILNPDGTLNKLAGEYSGKSIDEARNLIIEKLRESGDLVKQEDLEHSVKVDDRTDTPINFIKSKQWYVKIVDYKDKWLEMGKKINWYPTERFNDYRMWVETLNWDWCISRQRYYGVAFPIWYCTKCEEAHFVDEKLLPHDPSTDPCPFDRCTKCNNTKFKPEVDVLDTWATSSCTPFLIRELIHDEEIKKDLFPVSLRPNAFEIIRTWDFFSIVKSFFHFGIPPFKDVMISGHGLDHMGRKISKRLGNYIPSDELIEKYGADAIRYWATGARLGSNLRFNEDELKKGEKLTLKIWNAATLLSIHLTDENGNLTVKDLERVTLEDPDKWVISKLNKTISIVTKSFNLYEYSKARDAIENFFWQVFANYYLEFIKHRLYGNAGTSSKTSAISTAYYVFINTIKMIAPIMPFITEEVYSILTEDKKESIHISGWPAPFSVEKQDFDFVIRAVDKIREYKASQGLTIGKEIDEFKFENADARLKDYKEFLETVTRVKEIKL